MERRTRYRLFLCVVLICSVTALLLCWMLLVWEKVPATIHIRAGMQQELDLNVPVSGKLYRAGEAGGTGEAIPVAGMDNVHTGKSLSVDLNDKLTLYAEELQSYTMDLKLFGLIPFKTVSVQVITDKTLVPAGIPIGIYVKTQGILVVATGEFEGADGQTRKPAGHLLKEGDYILKADGAEVTGKADFMEYISSCEGREIVLEVLRGEEEFEVKVCPEQNRNGEYKLGIWIRDNAQGVGTLTYIDGENQFGALGHGINDMDTATLMSLKKGSLYKTEIVSITRGENGSPGELTGVIDYRESNRLGSIEANTLEGIFGRLEEPVAEKLTALAAFREWEKQENNLQEEAVPASAGVLSGAVPIGLKQEVKTGSAQILCSTGGEPETYEIEITDIHLDHDNVNRGLELRVTDERLLEQTGGIVQGMSGAPILQDGKIIGAITHVLVNDPSRGYGIFIETMLAH